MFFVFCSFLNYIFVFFMCFLDFNCSWHARTQIWLGILNWVFVFISDFVFHVGYILWVFVFSFDWYGFEIFCVQICLYLLTFYWFVNFDSIYGLLWILVSDVLLKFWFLRFYISSFWLVWLILEGSVLAKITWILMLGCISDNFLYHFDLVYG
jgi:hypothetical protein